MKGTHFRTSSISSYEDSDAEEVLPRRISRLPVPETPDFDQKGLANSLSNPGIRDSQRDLYRTVPETPCEKDRTVGNISNISDYEQIFSRDRMRNLESTGHRQYVFRDSPSYPNEDENRDRVGSSVHVPTLNVDTHAHVNQYAAKPLSQKRVQYK